MRYATVGTIKSLNLSCHTLKLDPISKYRFEVKDGDEGSWRIVFAIEPCKEPEDLKLVPQSADFSFENGLENAMVTLKQAKSKIKVVIEESNLDSLIQLAKDNDGKETVKETIGKNASQASGEKEDKTVVIEVL